MSVHPWSRVPVRRSLGSARPHNRAGRTCPTALAWAAQGAGGPGSPRPDLQPPSRRGSTGT